MHASTKDVCNKCSFSAHKDVITDLLAVRDLGLLVSASMDSDIKVWDLVGHELKRKLHGHTQGVYILDYIPSQRYLISAGFDYNCKVWNPLIEEPLFTLSGHVKKSFQDLAPANITAAFVADVFSARQNMNVCVLCASYRSNSSIRLLGVAELWSGMRKHWIYLHRQAGVSFSPGS